MTKRTKQRNWSEAELIDVFSLKKTKLDAPLLQHWLDAQTELNPIEQYLFDTIHQQAAQFIEAWSEEDLKMNFIAFVILLAHLQGNETVRTFFDKTIEATVDGHFLKTKTDFMIAKGILDLPKVPYFHFQEYKKDKDPYGDPLAQLLEAFLIAQEHNQNQKPLYGCYVIGRHWYFVVMQEKEYCVSMAYDCTVKAELLQIIAVLRQFKTILETVLLTSP